MRLVLTDGRELPVAQLGPDFVILEHAAELPPSTHAEMILHVDDSERRWPVTLPNGIKAESLRVRIAR
jgi:hypothetical protein